MIYYIVAKVTTNGISSTISHKYFMIISVSKFPSTRTKARFNKRVHHDTIHIYITRVVWNIL